VVSCGADKTLVLRQLVPKSGGGTERFSTERSFLSALEEGELIGNLEVRVGAIVTSKTPLFDLDTDGNGKHVLVACQDASVRVYNVSSGKHSKTLRNPALAAHGGTVPTIIKVTVDPSGYYVAVAATDKSITVFDYYKGDVVSTLVCSKTSNFIKNSYQNSGKKTKLFVVKLYSKKLLLNASKMKFNISTVCFLCLYDFWTYLYEIAIAL
jgi:WD40 repeat protein